jgi:glutathione peroxidase
VAEFCSATYGTTFPIFAKIEVNGAGRHELYKALVEVSNARGVDAVEALLLR